MSKKRAERSRSPALCQMSQKLPIPGRQPLPNADLFSQGKIQPAVQNSSDGAKESAAKCGNFMSQHA